MKSEPASVARIPSADRWAAIGAVIAIGALILTVTGWLRDDIQSLSTDLKTLDAKVDSIDKRLAVVESHVLGVPSVAQVEEEA